MAQLQPQLVIFIYYIFFHFLSFSFPFIQFDILFYIWILSNLILFYFILLYLFSIFFLRVFYFTLSFFIYLYFYFILFSSINDCGIAQFILPLFVSSSASTAWRGQTTTLLTLVPILHCQLSPDSNRLNCLQNLFYL